MNIMKENISLMTCSCAGTQLIDEVVTGLILYGDMLPLSA